MTDIIEFEPIRKKRQIQDDLYQQICRDFKEEREKERIAKLLIEYSKTLKW